MIQKQNRTWLLIVLLVLVSAIFFLFYTDLFQLMSPRPTDADAAFQQDMRAAKVTGAAMAFIRDGQIESSQGYGLTEPEIGREVTSDTLFTIASVSKTVTATALMTLYDQGKFGLDDDINAYLPFEVRNPNYPQSAITFRMLLTHTSSIRDTKVYEKYYTLQNQPVLPDSPLELGDYLRDYLSVDGSLYDAAQNFTTYEPGSDYLYSNTAFGLVGYLVEQISGQPFEVYCRQAVFDPLGMTRTAWFYRDVDQTSMAVPSGYNDLLRKLEPIGFYGFPTYPDGALKTSVNEYARFIYIFINEGKSFDGQPFLKPEIVQEILALHAFPGLDDESIGLAWHNKNGVYYHTGGDPGIFTLAEFNTKTKRAAVFFSTGAEDDLTGIFRQSYFIKNSSHMLKLLMTAE